jgi:hypothetical protein
MPKFTPEQIAARELVWRASQDGTFLALSADEAAQLWRSIADTGAELARLRDIARDALKTEAVKAALLYTARTGKSSIRNEDGTPSVPACVVGYGLLRGAEAVQQEIDAYVEVAY